MLAPVLLPICGVYRCVVRKQKVSCASSFGKLLAVDGRSLRSCALAHCTLASRKPLIPQHQQTPRKAPLRLTGQKRVPQQD